MASYLKLSLTDELHEFVNRKVEDNELYTTPSEYLQDLIRQDMESHSTAMHVLNGLNDITMGNFSTVSIKEIEEGNEAL